MQSFRHLLHEGSVESQLITESTLPVLSCASPSPSLRPRSGSLLGLSKTYRIVQGFIHSPARYYLVFNGGCFDIPRLGCLSVCGCNL